MPWEKRDTGKSICVHKKGESEALHCYSYTNERGKALAVKKADKYLAALYANAPEVKASMEDTILFEQVNGPIRFDIEATSEGDILIFKNAVLARAETNANGDTIDETGIQELAATIAGRPIDFEHRANDLRGMYTAGRPVDGMLSVDGMIWADRFPEDATKVKDGTLKQSIEATAKTAQCSVCGEVFGSSKDYCSHLMARRKSGATRLLSGLKAKGGALTYSPAATDANFDPAQLYFVASHQENTGELEAKISKREDVSPKEGKGEYGDVAFADETNKKYPLDSEGHIRSAWSYINMPKNAEKYSPEEVKSIKRKIVAAWKKKIDKAGPPSADNKTEGCDMDSEKKNDKPEKDDPETPEEEKKEGEPEVKSSQQPVPNQEQELQQKLAELQAKLDEQALQLQAAKDENAKLSQANADLTNKLVLAVLASKYAGDELKDMAEKVKGWNVDQVELLASVSGSEKPRRIDLKVPLDKGGESAPPAKDRIGLK